MKSRAEIIAHAKATLAEIDQIFVDAKAWNDAHLEGEAIEADPHGGLMRMRGKIKDFIEREEGAPLL